MSLGKVFAVCVCYSHTYSTTHIEINSHFLVYDKLELELSSFIVCS
jgi:hypothetical protein